MKFRTFLKFCLQNYKELTKSSKELHKNFKTFSSEEIDQI